MFTFWYDNQFKIAASRFNDIIKQKTATADRSFALQARNCLKGIIQLKHFWYYEDNKIPTKLIQLLNEFYSAEPNNKPNLKTELNHVLESINARLRADDPIYSQTLYSHRLHYAVFSLATVLCIYRSMNTSSVQSLLDFTLGLTCLMIAAEGAICNFSISQGYGLNDIKRFINYSTSEIRNEYDLC